jgi:hypothetical protein
MRLNKASVQFARHHIQRYWDSDFFPKPFEFAALWGYWPEVVAYLTEHDVDDLPAFRPRTEAAPKPSGGYRIVHQLDPLCALIYTALAHEIAPHVESGRAPVEDGIACAYRINISEDRGAFFGQTNGYETFRDRCDALANIHSYVLIADITDFYNQVSLHRLQNNIAHIATDLGPVANAIEDYVMTMNGGTSKGIPVGPAASIIMAETAMNDVDQYIANEGVAHTRYVDDIRCFADSPDSLELLLQKLTVYLYENHRLTLSSSKTKILGCKTFSEQHLTSPEQRERQEAHSRLNAYALALGASPKGVDRSELQTSEVMTSLMHQLIAMDVLDLGLARHTLRTSRKYRIRSILPLLFEHFAFFAPVINDVVLYLKHVSNGAVVQRYASAIAHIYKHSPAMKTRFVRLWFDDYVASYAGFLQDRDIGAAVMDSPSLGAQVTAAITRRDLSWFRLHRANIDDVGPWDRRQIMRSTLLLPADERSQWLRRLQRNHQHLLDKAVISWLLAQ